MRGLDESFQAVRPAVSGLDGEEVLRVVAPAVIPAEFVHRHEGDDIHPQPLQVTEAGDRIVECSRTVICGIRVEETADVQFIHDLLIDRDGRTHRRPPIEGAVVVDDGVTVADEKGPRVVLPGAAGVARPAQKVFVFRPRPRGRNSGGPITRGTVLGHGRLAPSVEIPAHRCPGRMGRPDPERDSGDTGPVFVDHGAQR